MVGPEGRRLLLEVKTLADGSATRFLHILWYGLANLKNRGSTSFYYAWYLCLVPQRGRCMLTQGMSPTG